MSEGNRVDTGTILRDLKDDPGAPFVPRGVTAKLRPEAREADQVQKLCELSTVGWLSREANHKFPIMEYSTGASFDGLAE